MKKAALLGLLVLSLCGCSIMQELEEANETIDAIYGEEVSIEEDSLPLAGMEEETFKGPEEVAQVGSVFYGILGMASRDGLLKIQMEVMNNGTADINFKPERVMTLYDGLDFADDPYEVANTKPTDCKLVGVIQPHNRISGTVTFDMPPMTDGNLYLVIEEGPERTVYALNRSDFDYVSESRFENGQITTLYGLEDSVVSDVLTITLDGVVYSKAKDGKTIASCTLRVKNVSDEERLFLAGYSIPCVHDLNGCALPIDTDGVTVPRVIEAGEEVIGIIPVIMGEEEGLYMTVRPDDNNLDRMEMILIN